MKQDETQDATEAALRALDELDPETRYRLVASEMRRRFRDPKASKRLIDAMAQRIEDLRGPNVVARRRLVAEARRRILQWVNIGDRQTLHARARAPRRGRAPRSVRLAAVAS